MFLKGWGLKYVPTIPIIIPSLKINKMKRHYLMNARFRLVMAVFWGIVLSFLAVEAAFACNPETEPCNVIFTLDDQNQMVLHTVEAGARTEGVLRLTMAQIEQAAQGPKISHNILKPHGGGSEDEFAETIKRLSSIPGLSFLNDPAAVQQAALEANGGAGQAMALSGATAGKNPMCAQMHLVLKATLEEATSASFVPSRDYITAPEIVQVCGHAAGTKMIEWYQAEQDRFHSSM